RGRLDEAAEMLAPLGPVAERAVDVQFVGPVSARLAELAIWRGRPDEALASLAEAIPRIEFTPEVRIDELHALGARAAADAAELAWARRDAAGERAARDAGERWLAALRARHAEVVAERPVYTQLSE